MGGGRVLIYLVIILVSFFFGWVSSLFLDFIDNLLKRLAFSIFFGFASAMWLSLFFSWLFFKQLGLASTLITIVILLLASIFLWKRARMRERIKLKPLSRGAIAIVALIVGIYVLLTRFTVLFTDNWGGWSGMLSVYGDYPFHLALINSFVLRDNFPPQYPILINTPLTYSFATDFLTAMLVKNGLGLREAIWFINIALFFCLIVFQFHLAEEFSSSKKVAAIALLLFFFNGNAGIINALYKAVENPGILLHPAQDFSHDEPHGLFFMNIIYAVFIPQRSILLGFTAVLIIYLLLFKNFSAERKNTQELMFAGLLFGLLPLMHAHSFLAAGVVAAFLFFYRPSYKWLYFIIPAALLAAPQMLWITQHTGKTFFNIQPGWLDVNGNKPFIYIFLFWIANGWIVLALSIAGLAFASRKQIKFYAPFIALFLAGNIIRFQPWDWDNYKIFMHWFLFASIFAAIIIVKLLDAGAQLKKRYGKRWSVSLRDYGFKALAVTLIMFGIASGILTVLWMAVGDNSRYEDFSSTDLKIAGWIEANTPDNAVFLTSDAHNNLVNSIAGRQIIMGLWWWLWSHGLNYKEVERDVNEIYRTGDCELIKKYGINYIYVGPQESKYNPNIAIFESRFEKVFLESGQFEYYIFKTKC